MPAVMQQVLAAGGPSAAVTYVGSSSSASTTLTVPTHQAGDLIIIAARRSGNVTPPSLPAGWTDIQSGGADIFSSRVAYIVASGSGTSSGTWTNASHLTCVVYRPINGTLSIGASAAANGTGASVSWSALTLAATNGLSWVAGFYLSSASSLPTVARSDLTARVYQVGISTIVNAAGDTNAPVTSWSSDTTTGPDPNTWRTVAVEIQITPT